MSMGSLVNDVYKKQGNRVGVFLADWLARPGLDENKELTDTVLECNHSLQIVSTISLLPSDLRVELQIQASNCSDNASPIHYLNPNSIYHNKVNINPEQLKLQFQAKIKSIRDTGT